MALKGKVLRTVTVLGALLLVVSGCSRDSGDDAAAEKKTVKLGVIAPLTGPLSELGLGIKNSVDLAIRQANEKGTVPGYEIILAAEDDTADPATGANAANKLASDPQIRRSPGYRGGQGCVMGRGVAEVCEPGSCQLVAG